MQEDRKCAAKLFEMKLTIMLITSRMQLRERKIQAVISRQPAVYILPSAYKVISKEARQCITAGKQRKEIMANFCSMSNFIISFGIDIAV